MEFQTFAQVFMLYYFIHLAKKHYQGRKNL